MASINNEVKWNRCDIIDITFRWVVQHIHFDTSAAICHFKKPKKMGWVMHDHLRWIRPFNSAANMRLCCVKQMHSTGGGQPRLHLLTVKRRPSSSLNAKYLHFPWTWGRLGSQYRRWNSRLTVFHHDHGAHLTAVTLILTLSLQSSTLPCPLSFQPPTAPSLIPQQAHSPQERIRDRLKESGLFPRVRASVLLSARVETNGQWARATRG